MCLIGFAWQASAEYPFVLVANRDEFHRRPTQTLQWWQGQNIAAGRDLEAQGTWLGVNRSGRFAAITNFREPSSRSFETSRGHLVTHVLDSIDSLDQVTNDLDRLGRDCAGFNLLFGDLFGEHSQVRYLSNRDDFRDQIKPGVYAFSNGTFDSDWPKSLNIHERLSHGLHRRQPDQFWQLLEDRTQAEADTLPDTGITADMEKFLSSIFIVGDEYGTRSSHRILLRGTNQLQISERRFSAQGELEGSSTISFKGSN